MDRTPNVLERWSTKLRAVFGGQTPLDTSRDLEPRKEISPIPGAFDASQHSVLPIAKPVVKPRSPWPDNSGQISIRKFDHGTPLPLEETGVYLGRGAYGRVDKVVCNGEQLARKTIDLESHAQKLREVSILKKLSHQHIIKIVGAYNQDNMLGILLQPVASCNLKEFFWEVGGGRQEGETSARSEKIRTELELASYPAGGTSGYNATKARIRLRRMFGCLANALEYIHGSGMIAYKDLKPENILVTHDKVYFTDFGTSHDLSEVIRNEGTSHTAGDQTGTQRYYAPETDSLRHGREVDVFSLGCVFLEMLTVLNGFTLLESDKYITANRPRLYRLRYCNDLPSAIKWLQNVRKTHGGHGRRRLLSWSWDSDGIFDLVEKMMKKEMADRPKADEISITLISLGGSCGAFHEPCCDQSQQVKRPEPITDFQLMSMFVPKFNAACVATYVHRQDMQKWNFVEALLLVWSVPMDSTWIYYIYACFNVGVIVMAERLMNQSSLSPAVFFAHTSHYLAVWLKAMMDSPVPHVVRNETHANITNRYCKSSFFFQPSAAEPEYHNFEVIILLIAMCIGFANAKWGFSLCILAVCCALWTELNCFFFNSSVAEISQPYVSTNNTARLAQENEEDSTNIPMLVLLLVNMWAGYMNPNWGAMLCLFSACCGVVFTVLW
ncbi:hypothetical protein MMC26_002659 [Xylographa opegraphella]|nr:hypothetical protein [Xylographa opegraphella]